VLAVFLSGGVGALFGVNASRASWHVGFLPAQFPVFSLTSGVALMLIIFGWLNPARDERGDQLIKVLSLAMVMLLLVKAYYLWTDLSLALYSGVPQNVEAARTIMFGPYGWAFWVLQVGLGMLVPLAALLIPAIRRRSFLVGLMGLFVLVGMGVARANIIFPALTIPELEGLTTAFTGPHLTFSYTPSPMEWSVLSAVVGLAVLAYLIGVDTLPIFGEKPARGSGRTPVLPARPTEVAQ
jgi:molybdopterin-containing oxidoreductase family membrane subunit